MVDDMRTIKQGEIKTVTVDGKDITEQIAGYELVVADEPSVRVKVQGVFRAKTYEVPLAAGDGTAAGYEAEARRMFHDEFPDMSGAVWSVSMVDSVIVAKEGRAAVRGKG